MVVEKGFKKTEIGVIPENWNSIGIQDLINNNFIVGHLDGNHGALYPRSNEFIETGVPYIGANDFYNGRVLFSNCKYLSLQRASVFRKGIAIDGDVLFAHNATVGPAALLRTNFDFVILSTTATYFRCNSDKILNLYLLYFLQSQNFIKQFSAVMAQSTRNQIPITAQRKLNVILPPLPEQTAIANALSDMDVLIAQTEKLIEKKNSIKQGVMQELLKPKEGWVTKKLGEVCEIYTGKKNNQDKIDDGQYPFFVRSQTVEKINSYSYDGEAILVPGEGNIGKIFHYINGKFDFHQRVYKISDFSELLYPKYVYLYLKENFGKYALSNTVKATVDSLRLPTFQEFKIPFPIKIEEQKKIAEIVFEIENSIELLETKLTKLKHQKQGMMQALLTGKIRLI